MKPTTQDLLDITEHFRTSYRDPHKPLTPEAKQSHDDAIARINAQFDLAPPIDVPEPLIRFRDVTNFFSIVLIGVFLLYAGVFIGGLIAHFLR